MGIAFVKFLKWLLSVSFFILGIALLQEFSRTGDIRPVGGVVISFGIVFWTSKSTYEGPKKIFLTSLAVLAAGGLLARLFVADFIAVFLGGGPYLAWFLCVAAIGLPVMIYTFLKEG